MDGLERLGGSQSRSLILLSAADSLPTPSSHTNTQHTDGLYGAIVVHELPAAVPSYDGDDLVLLLSDLYNTWSPLLAAKYLSVSSIKHIGSGC